MESTQSKPAVQFKKLNDGAVIPSRATKNAAGFDLYALRDTLIVGGAGNVIVPTGIAVQLPPGTYGRIAMRSGLAVKQHLTVSAGVIDVDYTGELGVVVSCTKIFDLKAPRGYRVCFKKSEIALYTEETASDSLSEHHNSLQRLTQLPDTFAPVYPVIVPYAYLIKQGERFAQLIVEKVSYAPGVETPQFERAYDAHGGFGSTGETVVASCTTEPLTRL